MKRIRTLPTIVLLAGFLAAPAALAQNNAEQRGIIDCGIQYATCMITQNIFTCSAEFALCMLGGGGGSGSAAMDRRD
jgi:hypothetical protein